MVDLHLDELGSGPGTGEGLLNPYGVPDDIIVMTTLSWMIPQAERKGDSRVASWE